MTAATHRARMRRRGTGALPSRQRGVALLVAILLVALGTIVAAAMAYDNAMAARRAAATFDFDQALLTAQGAEALAAYALQQTVANSPNPIISPSQAWAQQRPPMQVSPGVMLEASLQDLQGRFNINSLVQQDGNAPNPDAIAAFQRLLKLLSMDPKWADYLVDWIDKNSTPMFPEGAEDSVYMEMNPPYRTPNLPITSTSEMMALPGFTRADFDRLAPYIVALPLTVTKINLCTASPQLLDALTGVVQFSADPAEFQKERESAPCFPTQTDFLAGVSDPHLKQYLTNGTAQTSSWFRLTSFVAEGSTEFAIYSTLFMEQSHLVRPVLRSFTPN
jgi:general secretion pathway protein K